MATPNSLTSAAEFLRAYAARGGQVGLDQVDWIGVPRGGAAELGKVIPSRRGEPRRVVILLLQPGLLKRSEKAWAMVHMEELVNEVCDGWRHPQEAGDG